MFEKAIIDALAKQIAKEIVNLGAVAPQLMALEQAASYLGMTTDALRFKV